jgi:hypothetical protein
LNIGEWSLNHWGAYCGFLFSFAPCHALSPGGAGRGFTVSLSLKIEKKKAKSKNLKSKNLFSEL